MSRASRTVDVLSGPACAAPPRLARGMSGFWTRQVVLVRLASHERVLAAAELEDDSRRSPFVHLV